MSQAHARPPLPTAAEIARLPPDGGPAWNRLIFEKSPYLQQHAANPVDWRPWGPEAFAEAARRDCPVFLSVGYSTCHWCHVMERECFEDDEVAALLNASFVCVKVDREERPDIDSVYMTVTQALTGSGGWPMTVIMTPDRKPFFAGTYFPKAGRHGRPGLLELAPALSDAWKSHREDLLLRASKIAEALAEQSFGAPGEALDGTTLALGAEQLARRFDPVHGGFGHAPKFPTPHQLSFLLRQGLRTGDARLSGMAEQTLIAMRRGGIFDHVGFGWHRYSTDREWLLPHFEKMLYDQALMTLALVDAFQATGHAEHADVARETIEYVLRDLTSPEGGFFSAEDADSEGEEGLFYVWTPEEIRAVLGPSDGERFITIFGIEAGGNFRDQATGERTGASIPHLGTLLAAIAGELGVPVEQLACDVEGWRARLFAARESRIHPFKDDKVLTDWNGLMIAACARAGVALDEPRYVAAASRAAEFALTHLKGKDGRLLKRWRGGEAGLPAHLEDHAFLIFGLLELYEATFDPRWLRESMSLTDMSVQRFADAGQGGFFLTASDGEALLVRPKDAYDGALPSGNSVMALNLVRLARLTGRADMEARAEGTFRAFSGGVKQGPSAHCVMLQALDFWLGPTREVVIVGEPESQDTQALLAVLRRGFRPNVVALLRRPGEAGAAIAELAPFSAGMKLVGGKAAAYVCTNFTCQAPVTEPAALAAALLGR